MLNPQLLEMLSCANCKGPLEVVATEPERNDGKLLCRRCGLAYIVTDGLPNMLPEQAEKIETPEDQSGDA
ncbi:MAG: Trm112 family protein [Calditrichaeota bacterium]|nr:Trm112 family protein [Calditrichota bacterium]MCB0296047.1 Trm112 family protein [Calditrichota bacterium]